MSFFFIYHSIVTSWWPSSIALFPNPCVVLRRVLLSSLPFCGGSREGFFCILSLWLFQFCGLGGLLCPFTCFWLRRYPGIPFHIIIISCFFDIVQCCCCLLYHVFLDVVVQCGCLLYHVTWCCCSMLLFNIPCYLMLLFNVVVYVIMFSWCCCLLYHVTWCCCSILLFIISCCMLLDVDVVHNRLELTYFV